MAAITFPSSPTTGQIFTAANSAWSWDGTAWRVVRNTNLSPSFSYSKINFNGATLQEAKFFSTTLNCSVVTPTGVETLTNKTFTGYTETVFTITDAAAFEINPNNGSIQTITLGANRTPKGTNFAAGQSVILMIDDGAGYTITWTDATFGASGVTWIGGIAPTLATTGYTVIVLWEVGTQVYGALVGTA